MTNSSTNKRGAAPKKATAKPKATANRSRKGIGGRPSIYSQEITTAICARIAEGVSLRKICEMDGMPAKPTVFNWLARYPEFVDQYTRAKQQGAEVMAEELLEIADDGTNDWIEKLDKDGNPIGEMLNHEHVQRSKLRIDTRKWLLAKLQPKKYGEKIDLNHGGQEGNPVLALLQQVSGNTLKPTDDDPNSP